MNTTWIIIAIMGIFAAYGIINLLKGSPKTRKILGIIVISVLSIVGLIALVSNFNFSYTSQSFSFKNGVWRISSFSFDGKDILLALGAIIVLSALLLLCEKIFGPIKVKYILKNLFFLIISTFVWYCGIHYRVPFDGVWEVIGAGGMIAFSAMLINSMFKAGLSEEVSNILTAWTLGFAMIPIKYMAGQQSILMVFCLIVGLVALIKGLFSCNSMGKTLGFFMASLVIAGIIGNNINVF